VTYPEKSGQVVPIVVKGLDILTDFQTWEYYLKFCILQVILTANEFEI